MSVGAGKRPKQRREGGRKMQEGWLERKAAVYNGYNDIGRGLQSEIRGESSLLSCVTQWPTRCPAVGHILALPNVEGPIPGISR